MTNRKYVIFKKHEEPEKKKRRRLNSPWGIVILNMEFSELNVTTFRSQKNSLPRYAMLRNFKIEITDTKAVVL